MLSQLEFSQYNFRILNFNYLFKDIEINIINDLHTHHLLKDRVDTNARRFFYHHIIHGLCETLIKNKVKEKTIIYFNRLKN